MEDEITLISNKKRKLFEFNEKMYRLERVNASNDRSYFSCYNCGVGRLNSSDGGTTFVEKKLCSENCNSSPDLQRALMAKQALIKMCAERIDLTPQACYENARRELQSSYPESMIHFPSYRSMATNLKRAKSANFPAIPTSYASLPAVGMIPNQFQLDYNGEEQFLFLDLEYVPETLNAVPQRILAFMSINSSLKLCQADKIFDVPQIYLNEEGEVTDDRLKAFLEYFINQWLVNARFNGLILKY